MRIAAIATACSLFALTPACGGVVVFDDGGGGGDGGASSTTNGTSGPGPSTAVTTVGTSVGTSSVASSSTGGLCDEHEDCGVSPGEDVCIFTMGECAQRCGPGSPPCPPGFFCDDCATSSCPFCADCLGACRVID